MDHDLPNCVHHVDFSNIFKKMALAKKQTILCTFPMCVLSDKWFFFQSFMSTLVLSLLFCKSHSLPHNDVNLPQLWKTCIPNHTWFSPMLYSNMKYKDIMEGCIIDNSFTYFFYFRWATGKMRRQEGNNLANSYPLYRL